METAQLQKVGNIRAASRNTRTLLDTPSVSTRHSSLGAPHRFLLRLQVPMFPAESLDAEMFEGGVANLDPAANAALPG